MEYPTPHGIIAIDYLDDALRAYYESQKININSVTVTDATMADWKQWQESLDKTADLLMKIPYADGKHVSIVGIDLDDGISKMLYCRLVREVDGTERYLGHVVYKCTPSIPLPRRVPNP